MIFTGKLVLGSPIDSEYLQEEHSDSVEDESIELHFETLFFSELGIGRRLSKILNSWEQFPKSSHEY